MASRSGGYTSQFSMDSRRPLFNMPDLTKEMTPDLLLKMSKKIAQLTKVIYSLNTKNDDLEEIGSTIKESYEEEISRIKKEASGKVESLNSRLSVISELENTIDSLKAQLQDVEKERNFTIKEFTDFKASASVSKSDLEKEFMRKLNEVSSDLEIAKTTLEKRTSDFENASKLLQAEMDTKLKELGHQHVSEIEDLIKAHRVRYNELENSKLQLMTQLDKKTDLTSEAVDKWQSEKKLMEEEFSYKLEKQNLFFKKELEVQKNKYEEIKSEMEAKEEKIIKDNNCFVTQLKRDFDSQLKKLETLNNSKDLHINELNEKLKTVSKQLTEREKENFSIREKLSTLKTKEMEKNKETENVATKLSEATKEAGEFKMKLDLKCAHIKALEAQISQQTEEIKKLRIECQTLESNLLALQSEKSNLKKQNDSFISKSVQELESLKKSLKEKDDELKSLAMMQNQDVTMLKSQHNENIKQLKEEHSKEISKLKTDSSSSFEELTRKLTIEYETERHGIKKSHEKEKENLIKEKQSAIDSISHNLSEAKQRMKELEVELKSMQDKVQEQDQNIKNYKEQNEMLNEQLGTLSQEHMNCGKNMEAVSKKLIEAEGKCKKLEEGHMDLQNTTAINHNNEMKNLREDLEFQWSNRMKEEIRVVRENLISTLNKENKNSLDQLMERKEKEYYEMKRRLETEVMNLQKTLVSFKEQVKTMETEHSKSELELNCEINCLRKKYEEKLSALAITHNKETAEMNSRFTKTIQDLKDENTRLIKELEDKLKFQHQADLSFQIQAGKIALEAASKESEEKYTSLINDLQMKHKIEKDAMREALYLQQQEEIDQVTKEQEEKTQLVKDQLEKSVELRTKEFQVHSKKIEELVSSIKDKEGKIESLNQEVKCQEEGTIKMKRELETKVEEIRIVRREANMQIRKIEQQLAKAQRDEIDSLTAEHLREQQKLLGEFNVTKGALHEKITALQLMLENAEERFRRRESRPEDLEMIEELKTFCRERELECKKLIEDKRYLQLELLNRETNFNKVFSNPPNVGMINPLEAGKKKKKVREAWNSASTTRSSHFYQREGTPPRLEPIGNTFSHEQKLNSSKPLPGASARPIQ